LCAKNVWFKLKSLLIFASKSHEMQKEGARDSKKSESVIMNRIRESAMQKGECRIIQIIAVNVFLF